MPMVFKPKSVKTRVGEGLENALAGMYAQGVSTRKVARITEKLRGFEISSSEVSRASAELDKPLSSWRTRKSGTFPYLDARCEKVRHGGVVIPVAVLVGVGISLSGQREILGVSVELSENEVHWRHFLGSA